MELKTNVPVAFNKPGKTIGSITDTVFGITTGINMILEQEIVIVSYMYYTKEFDSSGNIIKNIINTGSVTYSFSEIQAIKDTLINTIPTGLPEMEEIVFKYTEGLRITMAIAFSLNPNQIVNS